MTTSKFLKITDSAVATQLLQEGFDCVIDRNGKELVYAFFATPELETLLASKYNNAFIVSDNRLSF